MMREKPGHRKPSGTMAVNILCILIVTVLAGCSSLRLESRWREADTPIDGKGVNWQDTLMILEDKLTSVGVLNDSVYLYVRLVTTNRDLEGQIVRQGLAFWFDRNGGEQKKFGIRFPLGFNRSAGFQRDERRNNENMASPRRDSIMVPVNDLEILGPDEGQQHRITFAEATGIDARFQTSHDTLTYTLKVPTSSSGYLPFTIGARPGTVIGMTIETSNTRGAGRSSEGSGEQGGRRGGGGFGGRGGYGGRGGSGYGGGRSGQSGQTKPFSQFAKVRLALPESGTRK
jgi:uncharacterized membrane protein YgcG